MNAHIRLPFAPAVKNTILALSAVATLAAALPARAGEGANNSSVSVQRGQVKSLQLGVGRTLRGCPKLSHQGGDVLGHT